MKNEFPMIAYRDESFMQKTTSELQEAKEAQQNLLDVWNGLNLPPLHKSLFELIHNPAGVYGSAAGQEPVTQGKYSLRPGVQVNITDVLCPDSLYRAARDARNHIQIGRPELWSVSADGKTVLLNETLAKDLIESQNIEVHNEAQKKFCEEVAEYVRLSNSVNEQLKAIPTMRMPAVPFVMTERSFQLIAGLELQPGQLREIIQSM